jgi:hypothetical protein
MERESQPHSEDNRELGEKRTAPDDVVVAEQATVEEPEPAAANQAPERRGEAPITVASETSKFPWTEWQFLVGAKEPLGTVLHAYHGPRNDETLCGAPPSMTGASVFPRLTYGEEGERRVADSFCPDCLAEADRRWGEHPDEQAAEGSERQSFIQPRIYVASLSDYNNGALHGVWLNADQDSGELHAAVQRMLEYSQFPGAEEYAIHDYEGFQGFELHEYEPLATVARLAKGIVEQGEPYALLASRFGIDEWICWKPPSVMPTRVRGTRWKPLWSTCWMTWAPRPSLKRHRRRSSRT